MIEMFSDQWELYRVHVSPAGRLDERIARESDIVVWWQIIFRKQRITRHKKLLASMRLSLVSANEKVSTILRKEIERREEFLSSDEQWLHEMRQYDRSESNSVDHL